MRILAAIMYEALYFCNRFARQAADRLNAFGLGQVFIRYVPHGRVVECIGTTGRPASITFTAVSAGTSALVTTDEDGDAILLADVVQSVGSVDWQ
jgi:uncharacterized protein (DUF2141 family)